jgi:prepilin signal peptidase PulO-like enzyme (type II secretory pathway)
MQNYPAGPDGSAWKACFEFLNLARGSRRQYLSNQLMSYTSADARHHRLPDPLTLPSYPIALALLAIAVPFTPHGIRQLAQAAIGAAASLALYTLLALIGRGAIGRGDVKLSGVLGLYLAWQG